ncbi:hypothetical protein TWF281_010047 [Arthrobotrys megalospora]
MAGLTLQSLPHDIIWCILVSIDNKPDLANLCAALPDTAGTLTQKWTSLYDRLYWDEIEEHHFPHLSVLNLLFNGDNSAVKMLKPPFRFYDNGAAMRSRIRICLPDAQVYRPVRHSLSLETACRMKEIHVQIERMAEIFMRYQLEGHHPPPESYRQPTVGERRRVIKAVYNAWLIGLGVLLDPLNTDPSLVSSKLGPKVGPLYSSWYGRLVSDWTLWEMKETRAVFNILWKEIPRKLSQRYFSKLVIEKGRDNVPQFLDFLYSDHEWSPGKYLTLFDRRGGQDDVTDAEMLKYLGSYGAATRGVSCSPPSSPPPRLLLERLDLNQRLKRQFLGQFDQKLQSHERYPKESRGNSRWGCRPDAFPEFRRLIGKSPPPPPPADHLSRYRLIRQEYMTPLWNWTRMGNVMLDDCLWDDWRLEGWGYQFPRVDVDKVYFPRDEIQIESPY